MESKLLTYQKIGIQFFFQNIKLFFLFILISFILERNNYVVDKSTKGYPSSQYEVKSWDRDETLRQFVSYSASLLLPGCRSKSRWRLNHFFTLIKNAQVNHDYAFIVDSIQYFRYSNRDFWVNPMLMGVKDPQGKEQFYWGSYWYWEKFHSRYKHTFYTYII